MIRDARAMMVRLLLTLSAVAWMASAVSAEQLHGTGRWQSLSGDPIKGTWSVALVRAGANLQGSLSLTGSDVFAGGNITGTLDGTNIVLGIMTDGAKQATFSGRLDGDSIKGEWESDAAKDHGVWFGTLSAATTADGAN